MNRYPLWKYATIVVALIVSIFYTLPNFFGEAPAVQISASKSAVAIDSRLQSRVENILSNAAVNYEAVTLRPSEYLLVRFKTPDEQIKARDIIHSALIPDNANPSYTIALNLVSRSPEFFRKLNAAPMYLGLDLRGGVHFMLELDMDALLQKRLESIAGSLRTKLRENQIKNSGFKATSKLVSGEKVHSYQIDFQDATLRTQANQLIAKEFPDLTVVDNSSEEKQSLSITLQSAIEREIKEQALKQNLATLRNRINELGVAEPIVQQHGLDRIIVQLPGIQDTAQAKDILGRTATLEMRMVDHSIPESSNAVPFGSERYFTRDGQPVIVKRRVLLTGENLTDARPSYNEQNQAVVLLRLDSTGASIFHEVTRKNTGKQIALLIFEKGQGEVVTAPRINEPIPNGNVQISGNMSFREAQTTSLLLRAGSLAAPMEIIEERTIGPSLGAENIQKGIDSVVIGFMIIVVFMMIYYRLMGVLSSVALAFNLVMLMAVMSMLQATLTLPGIAALALSLGMAIDSNVLINERIREELRVGSSPQTAINLGFDRAWATILDANITTLIAAVALLAFGSGPIRGFAIVHALGVLTSMFTSVFFMRGLVNFWYGRQKRLQSISIGQIWRPDSATDTAASSANQLNHKS